MSTVSPMRIALLAGLTVLLAGCATPSTRFDSQQRRAVTILAMKTDADSLAAAGLLSLLEREAKDAPLSLIARAVEAAPDRPDLLWLQIQVCHESPRCDPDPMERRLRMLDPSNGVIEMGALARADASRDDEAKDAALAAMSRSNRVDLYWTTLIAHLGRATVMSKALSPWQAEIAIIGVLAGQEIPAYAPVSNACKGDRLKRSEIVESCRGVARALLRGDTYLTEMMGVAIAKRVWPEDSPEWRAAADARRLYDYRARYSAQLEQWEAKHAEQLLAMCAANPSEQEVLKAQLVATGRNPNPPPQ